MSSKNYRADDWMGYLVNASSKMPEGDFTYTDANNGLLDGFSFEMSYGEGVLDGARLPEAKGLSKLPDGVMFAEENVYFEDNIDFEDIENGPDFDVMLSVDEGGEDVSPRVARAASLADLEWLDPTQEQDPDRLPKELRPDQPPLDSVPELENAWKQNKPETGLKRIPHTDLEVTKYRESIKERQVSGLPGTAKTADERRDAVFKAARRVHWGHDLNDILSDVEMALGDTEASRKIMASLKADYGLAGNVFVRASVFPGLHNGRWVSELKKKARTARYVITDNQMIADKLGKQLVSSVPWKQAVSEYTPWLQASGYKIASGGGPKSTLRRAFLAGPIAKPVEGTNFPKLKQRLATDHEVREELQRVSEVTPETFTSTEEQIKNSKIKKAMVRVAQLVKDQRLSQIDATKLWDMGQKGVEPHKILQMAASMVVDNQIEVQQYEGGGEGQYDIQTQRKQPDKETKAELQDAVQQKLAKRTATLIQKAVNSGFLTKQEGLRIWKSSSDYNEVRKKAEAAVVLAEQLRVETLVETEVADYTGPDYNEGAQAMRQAHRVVDANAENIKIEQARKRKALANLQNLVAKQVLTPDEADDIIQSSDTAKELESETAKVVMTAKSHKYQGHVQKAAVVDSKQSDGLDSETARLVAISKKTDNQVRVVELSAMLRWLRQQLSEGLAGKDLTDLIKAKYSPLLLKAAAPLIKEIRTQYEGLSGFLYVDAEAYASPTGTAGCEQGALRHRANALKTVMAMPRCKTCTYKNAEGFCSLYNKELVTAPPVKDPKAYQKKVLNTVDDHDAVVTAAMFNPKEFNLQNPLEQVSLDNEIEHEHLGNVLFGQGGGIDYD